MKYLALILSIIVLTACSEEQSPSLAKVPEKEVRVAMQADIVGTTGSSEVEMDYERVDAILADISAQMHQPNVLKSDILRGWYMGAKSDKKYGTPDTWIFVEDGINSKWISPNMLEDEDLIDNKQLCKQTAGTYYASCLESSDSDCEYVEESYCQCLASSKWKDGQGCVLTTERGSYVSINNSELEKGWYYGLPNEKKLNTPTGWVWVENGRESAWQISK